MKLGVNYSMQSLALGDYVGFDAGQVIFSEMVREIGENEL